MTVDNTPYFRTRRPLSESAPRGEPRAWRQKERRRNAAAELFAAAIVVLLALALTGAFPAVLRMVEAWG